MDAFNSKKSERGRKRERGFLQEDRASEEAKGAGLDWIGMDWIGLDWD